MRLFEHLTYPLNQIRAIIAQKNYFKETSFVEDNATESTLDSFNRDFVIIARFSISDTH